MRFLPTRKAGHLCGHPPTYHLIVWIPALNSWRCTGCGAVRVMPKGYPGTRTHGKAATYSNGCRCDKCREAFRVYMMAYRRSKGVRPEAQYREEAMCHGITRYRKGCRCDVCRAASARIKRGQRARNPEYRARDNAKRQERR